MKHAAVLLAAAALVSLPCLAATVAAEENSLKVTVTGLN
jgi:hypothetical protein